MPETNEETQLTEFFDYLYGSETGFVYIARKNPKDFKNFKQDFFEWPTQKAAIAQFVLDNRAAWEVYMAPALFEKPKGTKADVKGASVFWCEFDRVPQMSERLPEPTLRVASGGEGHEHWYWKLDQVVGPDELDSVNRAIAYLLGADTSGYDAGQLLRPVNTFNHKREKEVRLVEARTVQLPSDLFVGLPQPPPPVEIERPDAIPPIEEVVFKYKWGKNIKALFDSGDADRSKGLMRLGYFIAEMGMSNEEMLAVMINADERWGKFSGRHDQVKRLLEIVTIARAKYPIKSLTVNMGDDLDEPEIELKSMGFLTLLRSKVELEWVWDGYLQKGGYMLMSGPSGIGKTQIALDAAAHFTNGLDFLERPVEQSKVGFLSLEMGLTDLKYFLMTLQAAYTPEQQEVMEEMLQIFPVGEPLYMAKEAELNKLDQVIGDLKLGGLIVDSLGDATDEDLSDQGFRKFFHRMSKLRAKHNCWMWFIHHNRKANGDNKKPNKLADVYGSQYITSQATSVFCLWDGNYANSLQILPLKIRLAKRPEPFHIHRDENLHFTLMNTQVLDLAKQGKKDEGHSGQGDGDAQSPIDPATGAVHVDMGAPAGPGKMGFSL